MKPDTGREDRAASGSTTLDLGARDEAWDAGAAEKAMSGAAQLAQLHFWKDPDGDPAVKGTYKLPFGTPDDGVHAVWRGVTAAAGRLGQTQIPDADMAGVKAKIAAYYAKAAKKYDDDSITVPWASSSAADDADVEVRFIVAPITHVDVRDTTGNPDDTWTMSGYAAVFNQQTTLYDGKMFKVTESIDPAAFENVLRSQPLSQPSGVVHFNLGHDMNRSVAASDVPSGQPGSLTLGADAHGLHFLAKVARDDPDGVAMASKMRTGVLRQASFAFTIDKATWTSTENDDAADEDHRVIQSVKQLYDVCACPQGAYPQTVSQLRSYAAAIGHPLDDLGGGHARQPDLGGASLITPLVEGVRGVERVAAMRAAASAEARLALHRYPRR